MDRSDADGLLVGSGVTPLEPKSENVPDTVSFARVGGATGDRPYRWTREEAVQRRKETGGLGRQDDDATIRGITGPDSVPGD
jgi:hypothetical protein